MKFVSTTQPMKSLQFAVGLMKNFVALQMDHFLVIAFQQVKMKMILH